MSILFFIPLTLIALFESQVAHTRSDRLRDYFSGPPPEEEGDPKVENPGSDDPNGEISTISFEDLVKVFPKCAWLLRERPLADPQYCCHGERDDQPRDQEIAGCD
jgi:hypothetical protein